MIALDSGNDLISIRSSAKAIKDIVNGKRTTRSEDSSVASGFEVVFYARTDDYGHTEYSTFDIQDSTQLTIVVDGENVKEPLINTKS